MFFHLALSSKPLAKINGMAHFRFMELDIWKESIELNDRLFDLADKLSDAKSFRVAEQLRGASLSISNNIAEGSGYGIKKTGARCTANGAGR